MNDDRNLEELKKINKVLNTIEIILWGIWTAVMIIMWSVLF